ncbi:hypothetical protein RclHR1_04990010 [Rhizophagus clarus]|uniref:BTB domain-containing protein n=1 Tax=Rhizophagus clarus TaxID=94130 RepID=A0A2Z6SD85_9GLOM|nr:hypothetical protein RclHR1_04990010 [Rhizophagus clarus]
MTVDLTSSLLRDIGSLYKRIEMVENDEDCDVTLKVKKNCFKAHSVLLKARSKYLRNLIDNENDRLPMIFKRNVTIEISNMSSNIFKTCLNYIYTGEILLKDYDDNESIFDLVIGADILSLTYMVDYLQNYFIKKKSFWIERNLIRIYQISLKNQNFQVLLSYCEKLIKQEPTLLFDAENLITLEKENLINIIKWDDLPLREVKIWCGLVKWIVGQKPPMNKVISNWNDSDFKEFERRIKDFIPYIRFFSIASDEYSDDVRSFRRILPKNLVEKLEVFYLKKTPPPYDELPPRKFFDSIILTNKTQIKHIKHWIYGYNDFNENNILKSNIDLILLARGSRDGMERDVFHSLCDNKGPTIVLAIVDQTNDIIGGYNPSSWTGSNEWVETTESFIFSFRSGNGFDDIVLSRIINPMAAIWDGDDRFDIGFSSDLQLFNGEYKHENYENRIINYENFKITNYEVFQVKNKKYSSF